MLRLALFPALVLFAVPAWAGELFDAAKAGDTAEISRLLDASVPVDEPGRNAETPLMGAALAGQTEAARLLVGNGADISARNKGGLTPLHAAAYSGSSEIAQLLLDAGATVDDSENISGATPLFLAAEENHPDTAALLISAGADVTAVDRDGLSVLTQAWAKKRTGIVALLKENGATCQPADILGSEEFYRLCTEAGN